MSVTVVVELNGASVPVVLDDEAIAKIAAAIPEMTAIEPESPYLTIPEAADYMRCKRQRIDDLLSSGRLTRHKDGARTLVERAELEAYLSNGRRRVERATTSLEVLPRRAGRLRESAS